METRVAVIGVIVEDLSSVERLNRVFHEYADAIIGIISVAVDASQDIINALSGKIGRIPGVTAKTAYSSYVFPEEL